MCQFFCSQGKLDPEKRSELVDQGKALKARLAVLEAEVEIVEDALQREGQKLPNLSHPEVSFRSYCSVQTIAYSAVHRLWIFTVRQAPVGGEDAARVLKTIGTPCDPGFKVKDHLAVGIALDLIDFETGATVSGAKCALKHALRTCVECCLITGLLILDQEQSQHNLQMTRGWNAGLCTCGEQLHSWSWLSAIMLCRRWPQRASCQ